MLFDHSSCKPASVFLSIDNLVVLLAHMRLAGRLHRRSMIVLDIDCRF
jgi:hypothetical protein